MFKLNLCREKNERESVQGGRRGIRAGGEECRGSSRRSRSARRQGSERRDDEPHDRGCRGDDSRICCAVVKDATEKQAAILERRNESQLENLASQQVHDERVTKKVRPQ